MLKTNIAKREILPPQSLLLSANARNQAQTNLRPVPENGRRLVVGRDVRLRCAEIIDCDTLVIEGQVEASVSCQTLEISRGGRFCGTVSIDNAEIHGNFDGELEVRKQLVIHGSGDVRGKIRYAKLVIAEGGQLSGEIEKLNAE